MDMGALLAIENAVGLLLVRQTDSSITIYRPIGELWYRLNTSSTENSVQVATAHCANVFVTTGSNLSLTTQPCACAYIAFLAGITSCLWTVVYSHKYLYQAIVSFTAREVSLARPITQLPSKTLWFIPTSPKCLLPVKVLSPNYRVNRTATWIEPDERKYTAGGWVPAWLACTEKPFCCVS